MVKDAELARNPVKSLRAHGAGKNAELTQKKKKVADPFSLFLMSVFWREGAMSSLSNRIIAIIQYLARVRLWETYNLQ